MIHTDEDLALHWQIGNVAGKRWAFDAATNVFMYVTDKGITRRRGTTHWPEEVQFTPTSTVRIARLKYDGDYDPEPLAYERFARLMGLEYGIRVEVLEPMAIDQLPAAGAKLATLTGTSGFTLGADEKRVLRDFVAGGGTVFIDAAGGDQGGKDSKGFTAAVEAILAEMYPDERLQTLAATAPLFHLKGMEIEKVRWRRRTQVKLAGITRPLLKAILIGGRPGIIVSRHDVTAGLLGCPAYMVDGYSEGTVRNLGSAFELMRNITMYGGKVDAPSTTRAAQ